MQVTAINLVFTDYPSTDDLEKLNNRRLRNLFKKYPSLENDSSIEWQLIRQLNGAEKDAAVKLFHGFVICFRPLQNAATGAADITKLKEMLTPEPSPGRKKRNGFLAGDTMHLREQYEIEEYTFIGKMPVKKAEAYLDIDEQGKIGYKNQDSVYVYERPEPKLPGERSIMKAPVDSIVIKVLDRMPWNNMTIIADVTASMYPYTGQLLLWLKQHEEALRIKRFVFFNDGDNKEEDLKPIGNTGGIYSTTASEFEQVEELLYKVMSRGNGGAIPENNIEALLDAQSNCNNCELVMIADNNSAVSDMVLLNRLKLPVHIIVCGMHSVVNPDYIKIAKATHGSIHLMENDLLEP